MRTKSYSRSTGLCFVKSHRGDDKMTYSVEGHLRIPGMGIVLVWMNESKAGKRGCSALAVIGDREYWAYDTLRPGPISALALSRWAYKHAIPSLIVHAREDT